MGTGERPEMLPAASCHPAWIKVWTSRQMPRKVADIAVRRLKKTQSTMVVTEGNDRERGLRGRQTSGKEYVGLSLAAPEFGPRKLYANLNRAAGQQTQDTFAVIWNPPIEHKPALLRGRPKRNRRQLPLPPVP